MLLAFLKGAILSLIIQEKYKKVSIVVMDLGLSEIQKEQLKFMSDRILIFDIYNEIKNTIGISIDGPDRAGKMLIYARIYSDKIFNKWKYLFFIDCDGWINDGFVIDKFLSLCIKQKLALTRNTCWPYVYISSHMKENWRPDFIYSNIGIYCVDIEFYNFFSKLQQKFESMKYFAGIDEALICFLINTEFNIELLRSENNTLIHTVDWPCVYNDHLVLYDPCKPIGFLHFAWTAKSLPSECTTQVIKEKMSDIDIEEHKNIHWTGRHFSNEILISTRFENYQSRTH